MILIAACSTSEKEIFGLWKVKDVEVDADTTKVSNEVINQSVEMERSLSFEFFQDKTMNIITDGATFSGKWFLYSDDIFIKLDGVNPNDSTKVGEYEEGKIIKREKRPFGWIKTTYIKTEN